MSRLFSLLLVASAIAACSPEASVKNASDEINEETPPGGVTPINGPTTPGATPATPINGPIPVTFPKWIDGMDCAAEPKIQTFKYSENTFILRQSLCTHGEGPFMYLLVGKTKALLLDTGTGNVDVRSTVRELAGPNVELVVAHSHSHGDHVSGDNQFAGQPKTTVVGKQPAQVRATFGIQSDDPAAFDLGERVLDVMHVPGHEAAHIAIYDRQTQLFLTGDTLYPGRLFIDNWDEYKTSIPRLVKFAETHPIAHITGAHIELPKTGEDYPIGVKKHPNEHALELTVADLKELGEAVKTMGDDPIREVHKNFIVSP